MVCKLAIGVPYSGGKTVWNIHSQSIFQKLRFEILIHCFGDRTTAEERKRHDRLDFFEMLKTVEPIVILVGT